MGTYLTVNPDRKKASVRVVEIEAPVDGTLDEVSAKEGDFVKFGAAVAVIDN